MIFSESLNKENRPIHVFYYEDLKKNATFEMEKILDFVEEQKYFVVPDRDRRIKCLKSVKFIILCFYSIFFLANGAKREVPPSKSASIF